VIIAGWVVKKQPAAPEVESYRPLSENELDAELDRIEDEQKKAG
jgi:hypothetical protein